MREKIEKNKNRNRFVRRYVICSLIIVALLVVIPIFIMQRLTDIYDGHIKDVTIEKTGTVSTAVSVYLESIYDINEDHTLDIPRIQKMIDNFAEVSHSRYSYIIDSSGTIVAHPAMLDILAFDSDEYTEAYKSVLRGDSDIVLITENQVPYYMSFAPVGMHDYPDSWYVITLQDRNIVMSSVTNLVIQVIVIIVLVFVAFIIMVLGFYRAVNRMIDSLRRARTEAEVSSKAKSNFLANMSHEIRTPMNAILGITEIELQKEDLLPETETAFEKIYESGDLLLNIINDILDLSKIEADRLEIHIAKYDIPGLISDAVQLNRLRFENKPIEFKLEINENTPLKLYGDVLRIKQILNNILSNAFKYTEEGTVKLSVTIENLPTPPRGIGGCILIFTVTDTGRGMTADQLDKLFTEYTRFNVDANRTTMGTGLGMSITKRLLTMMGGEIQVRSEPNKGSVFTVRLPQERVDRAVCGPALAGQLSKLQFESKSKSRRERFMRESMPYGHVLVVDDVESNIYVTKGMLQTYDLKIDTARSGFEALEKVKKGVSFDIIFMDHMMPKMDGIETTHKLRSDMKYEGTIIALTANALVGQAEMYLEKGFDGFLSKPIDSRELNQILNDFIRDKKPPEVVKAARNAAMAAKSEKAKKAAGNADAAGKNKAKMKALFIQDALGAIKTLERISAKEYDLNREDIHAFEIAVHGMKSALWHIGEKKLAETSYSLEKACKANDLTMIVNSSHAFIDSLKKLVNDLKESTDT